MARELGALLERLHAKKAARLRGLLAGLGRSSTAPPPMAAALVSTPASAAPGARQQLSPADAAERIVWAFHRIHHRTLGNTFGTIAEAREPDGSIRVLVKRYPSRRRDAKPEDLGVVIVRAAGGNGLDAVTWTDSVVGDEEIRTTLTRALHDIRVLPSLAASAPPVLAPPAGAPRTVSDTLVSAGGSALDAQALALAALKRLEVRQAQMNALNKAIHGALAPFQDRINFLRARRLELSDDPPEVTAALLEASDHADEPNHAERFKSVHALRAQHLAAIAPALRTIEEELAGLHAAWADAAFDRGRAELAALDLRDEAALRATFFRLTQPDPFGRFGVPAAELAQNSEQIRELEAGLAARARPADGRATP